MRNSIWTLMFFFLGLWASSAQTKKIEQNTYLLKHNSETFKLNLLEDNKCEFGFFSRGNYEIKGDSLFFFKNAESENIFHLSFATTKKTKKQKNIQIKFLNPSAHSFYIGTQNGLEAVQYQKLSDISYKVGNAALDLEFEIEKTDYLYLVYEGYGEKTNVCKYTLPKDVSEITIDYEIENFLLEKVTGFFDKKTNELKISGSSDENPMILLNENEVQPEKPLKVVPIEHKMISNWTYPGKEYGAEDVIPATAVDDASAVVDSSYINYDFKLKIENSLKEAIESTKKAGNKFLVVYANGKKDAAKKDFDAFVIKHESMLGSLMHSEYNAEKDVFNFYLAGADDKNWLKKNKITTDPAVFVLNGQGDLLAIAKSELWNKEYQFYNYSELYRKLVQIEAYKTCENKKATDSDLIEIFNKVSVLDFYGSEGSYDSDALNSNSTEFVTVPQTFDRKKILQAYKKLIEAHHADTKPNMYLVEVILKQIDKGFAKDFFSEKRIMNDTDFLSIDYLLKHADAIDENNKEKESKRDLISEISSALEQNFDLSVDCGKVNREKIISIYKKINASGKGNFEMHRNYFTYLATVEDNDGSNTSFLREFNTYFDSNLVSESPIEKLDGIFSSLYPTFYEYGWEYGWESFKEYHSNLCNSAAWKVVEKPQNASFIKNAVVWSEYSLAVSKNNPYYLDTLAQLYYKDGQKEKAIATQFLAVKFLNDEVEEITAKEIKETLVKMQNGTY